MAIAVEAIRLGDALLGASTALAHAIMEREYTANPGLREQYGARGAIGAIDDARAHVMHLAEAVSAECPQIYQQYIAWWWGTIEPYGIAVDELYTHLETLEQTIAAQFEDQDLALVRESFRLARAALAPATSEASAPPDWSGPFATLAASYLRALLTANRPLAVALIVDAADAGTLVQDLYLHVIQPVQHEIGRLWQVRQISIAQEHYATAVAQLVMSLLYPRVVRTPKTGRRLVAACVGADLHEIGVRMVSDSFELAGWDAYYVGACAPTPALIDALEAHKPDVLAVSVTLAIHLPELRGLVRAVRESPHARTPILVGGAPFRRNADLWRRYGADAYAEDAVQAVEVGERISTERGSRS